jgi:hypothetical protein
MVAKKMDPKFKPLEVIHLYTNETQDDGVMGITVGETVGEHLLEMDETQKIMSLIRMQVELAYTSLKKRSNKTQMDETQKIMSLIRMQVELAYASLTKRLNKTSLDNNIIEQVGLIYNILLPYENTDDLFDRKWIDIETAYPEKHTYVLVSTQPTDNSEVLAGLVYQAYWSGKRWFDMSHRPFAPGCVTHWMEQPRAMKYAPSPTAKANDKSWWK